MDYILPLMSMAMIQLLAVMSPGQSFFVVSRLSLSEGRKSGVAAAFGMALGTFVWAGAAIAGLAIFLKDVSWVYSLLKIIGGAYLLYIAIQAWRHANEPLDIGEASEVKAHLGKAFGLGVATQLANPKVVVFFGSIFFALLPSDAPLWVYGVSLLIVSFNEAAWYSLVSLCFSAQKPRAFYMSAKSWIERGMAIILGGLGLRLITESLE